MTDGDFEHLYERAGAALRAPAPGDDAARDRLVRRIRAEPPRSTTRRGIALLPWWAALAAAAVAFAVGLGTGRATKPTTTTAARAPSPLRTWRNVP